MHCCRQALLLAPLAALQAKENSPRVPRFGKISAGSFQALEKLDLTASNDWNGRIKWKQKEQP